MKARPIAMPLDRRAFLTLLAALPAFAACGQRSALATKGLAMQPISAEELELLKNPLARPAYFARMGLPQGVLEIRQRVFGETRNLLRGADIENVRFVNCVFDLFQNNDLNLKDVVFEECRFLGAAITGDEWKNVKFQRCEAEGPFKIACVDGGVEFEECILTGMSEKEAGYGNWSDHFGLATAQDGYTVFKKCKLKSISTKGGKSLQLLDCEIHDLEAAIKSKNGVLHLEKCRATGKIDFGNSKYFSRITIKDSQLGEVDMMSVSSEAVEISNSSLSLEMGGVRGTYGDIKLQNTRFFGEGFMCGFSKMNSLVLDGCSFDSGSQGLRLFGEPNDQPNPGEEMIYWTRSRDLTIRNMQVTGAQLAYMQIGTLALDNATLKNTDLSHSRIDAIQFRNARLEGKLDLTETTIRRIDNQGLTNQAKVAGKLEADANAPMPELERPKLEAGKNSKSAKPE